MGGHLILQRRDRRRRFICVIFRDVLRDVFHDDLRGAARAHRTARRDAHLRVQLSRGAGKPEISEILDRLHFLVDVGLGYLSLNRGSNTLSGGEAQRIRLAAQVGSALQGVTYVLDEPSIGLHPRDNARLLKTLYRLRDRGNTVLVVEHDEDTIRAADHVVAS